MNVNLYYVVFDDDNYFVVYDVDPETGVITDIDRVITVM